MLGVLLFLLLHSAARLCWAECDFTAYYGYPNTNYCIDQQDTWSGGTSYFGTCLSPGGLQSCQCQCAPDGLSGVLRKCSNSFDSSIPVCYTGVAACPSCPQGSQRQNCGCNRFSPYDCGPGVCVPCPPDTFSVSGPCAPCAVCPPAYYAQIQCLSGQNGACALCPAGSYCAGGVSSSSSAQAVQCQQGTYCPKGSSAPIRCHDYEATLCDSAGLQYPVIGCRAGYAFSSSGGGPSTSGFACTACPAGTALAAQAPGHTVTACTSCSPGAYASSAAQAQCAPCAAGSYSTGVGFAGPCLQCPPGAYAPTPGLTACVLCAAGTFLSSWGASLGGLCAFCGAGAYASSAGSTRCLLCPGGSYAAVSLGASYCITCPAGKTTFVSLSDGSMLAPGGSVSQQECLTCPIGTYTCNCLNDTTTTTAAALCAQRNCSSASYRPCFSCGGSAYFCPGTGFRLPRSQPVLQQSFFLVAASNAYTDNVLANCSVCAAGSYASSVCTLTQNTVCRLCAAPARLLQRIVSPCNATANTVLAACGSGDALPGGPCNPCPAGCASGDACVPCPSGTFKSSEGQGGCLPCPPSTVSGPGAHKCTVDCGHGHFAPDGLNCISGSGVPYKLAAAWEAAITLQGGAQLSPQQSFAVVQNFHSSSSTEGYLWRIDGSGSAWGLLGPLPSAIFALVASPVVFLMTLPDLGSVRFLTINEDNEAVVKEEVWTPPQGIMVSPSGAAALLQTAFLVADQGAHCVWRLAVGSSSVAVWRGQAGAPATEFLLPDSTSVLSAGTASQATLLSAPTCLAVLPSCPDDIFPGLSGQLGIVMDSRAIWAFDTGDPSANLLLHLCGNPLYTGSDTTTNYCRFLNLAQMEIVSMAATTLVTSYYGGPVVVLGSLSRGLFIFPVLHQPSAIPLRALVPSLSVQSRSALFFGSGNDLMVVSKNQVLRVGTGALLPAFFFVSSADQGVSCLCDEGLYCNAEGQCVVAAAGTYAPAWGGGAPVPCAMGSVSELSGPCIPCSSFSELFTTHSPGALNCEPLCPSDQLFSSVSQRCVPGCNTSKGEYQTINNIEGRCLSCPLGSRATGGGAGVSLGCAPCPAQTCGSLPGVCSGPYPAAIFSGSVCDEQASLGGAIIIMAPAQDMSVSSAGSLYYVGTDGGLYVPSFSFGARYATGMAHSLLLEVTEDESLALLAQRGDSCVWSLRLNNNGSAGLSLFSGQCGTPGDVDGLIAALLGPIQDMALMQADGYAGSLFVSTLAASGGCASVRAVSLYDRSVSTLISADELHMPLIPIAFCPSVPFLSLTVPRGSLTLYYTLSGVVWRVDVSTPDQQPTSVLPQGGVQAMCALSPDWLLLLLLQEERGGSLLLLPPSSSSAAAVVVIPNTTATAIACAGKQVWLAEQNATTMHMVPQANGSCLGGFVSVVYDAGERCVQAGLGRYTARGIAMDCKAGTYGTTPRGSSSRVACQPCPDGTIAARQGAIGCDECPAGTFANPDHTACLLLPACPAGTFQQQQNQCAACSAGTAAPVGATSAAECVACQAGYYSNGSTGGRCLACPAGWTSSPGSFACVASCGEGQCAADGVQCRAVDERWEVVTSVMVSGTTMAAVGVGSGGEVFYTDGVSLFYFLDDCPAQITLSDANTCMKSGVDLLPALPAGEVRGFSALAVSPLVGGERLVYAVCIATHALYRYPILHTQEGAVDIQGTTQLLALAPTTQQGQSALAKYGGVWRLFGGVAGFVDGPWEVARMNTPSELELSSAQALVISDFVNSRIRLVHLSNRTVATLIGPSSSAWQFGPAATTASVFQPLGLGLSAQDLYVAMTMENMVGVVSDYLQPAAAYFSRYCALFFSNAANPYATKESCVASADSKTCMLNKPYDVLVSDDGRSLYVAVNQGLTRIDTVTYACQQIAGYWWNFSPSNRGLQDGQMNLVTGRASSLFNQPFKLAEDSTRGILYVADLLNGALRRIFISNACKCQEGSILVGRACYNPTPPWDARLLVQCPEGQFAMEDDAVCHDCAEAVAYGLVATACTQWAAQQRKSAALSSVGFSYAQLLAQPSPIGAVASDWYGRGPPPPSQSWDDIFRMDSPVHYWLGSGRAPWGGEFITLTLDATPPRWWRREQDPTLSPWLLLPGLWYPCAPVAAGGCSCSSKIVAFADEAGSSGGGRVRWNELRREAFDGGAQVLGSFEAIGMWSMFLVSPGFSHVSEDNPFLLPDAATVVSSACSMGWPAHYGCPDGYTWVAPNTSSLPALLLGFRLDPSLLLTSQVACISCLPGTFSRRSTTEAGGPYQCAPCPLGMFSSQVGSSACELCPATTYADAVGMSACMQCPANHWTDMGAQTALSCSPCAPGNLFAAIIIHYHDYYHDAAQAPGAASTVFQVNIKTWQPRYTAEATKHRITHSSRTASRDSSRLRLPAFFRYSQ